MYDPSRGILLSGSTFIKNAIKFSYPVEATIESLLYYCEEVIINIGRSDDGTEELLRSKYGENPKVKIFIRDWPGKEHGTLFYRQETNFAIDQCSGKWILHLQSDECVHENDYERLISSIKKYDNQPWVKGLSCRYQHFYGDFISLKDGYPFEVRVIRNDGTVESIGDACSWQVKGTHDDPIWKFTDEHGRDQTPLTTFRVFHYGYVRPPKVMLDKAIDMDSWYHKGKELEDMRNNSIKNNPNGQWNYGVGKDRKIGSYSGSNPIFAKDYIKKYESTFPDLIRMKTWFEDEI